MTIHRGVNLAFAVRGVKSPGSRAMAATHRLVFIETGFILGPISCPFLMRERVCSV